MNNNAVLYKM